MAKEEALPKMTQGARSTDRPITTQIDRPITNKTKITKAVWVTTETRPSSRIRGTDSD